MNIRRLGGLLFFRRDLSLSHWHGVNGSPNEESELLGLLAQLLDQLHAGSTIANHGDLALRHIQARVRPVRSMDQPSLVLIQSGEGGHVFLIRTARSRDQVGAPYRLAVRSLDFP